MADENIYIKNYYEKEIREGINKLFYAIMYRQWNEVENYILENNCNWNDLKELKYENTDISIQKCFEFNIDFLRHSKNYKVYEKICEQLGDEFRNLESSFDYYTYDDKRFCKLNGVNNSIFDIFWDGNQPVLNLKYFEKQTLAAKQVMKNNCSMVLDEVGTGKTVCGIFTIQQVIQERIDLYRDAKSNEEHRNLPILIICPYNKREDWHNDILRQLGLESHIINQSDDGQALRRRSEKKSRASIFISGNVGGNSDDSNQQLKKSFLENWDLVIIDECHNCFDSYENVRAKRVLLLTATPIVPTLKGFRNFSSYEDRINSILGGTYWNRKVQKEINPIESRLSNENEIYTCYFKEDIFNNVKIERDIRFIECGRVKERDEWFDKLRSEQDFFSAIYSDQDDEILAQKMKNIFKDEYSIEENEKLKTLISIITGKEEEYAEEYAEDSFIIFCENTNTVDLLYERISVYSSDKLMIGKLYSKVAEIKNVQTNKTTIIQKLKRNIEEGNRSILITTGKSGGTGINLGEFSGVIHYELPFTNNELEQRFGRIERADSLIEIESSGERKPISNKMIFLINKRNNKLDFITNRMLYYAVNKIRITAMYMPIRNTVLFHPEYMSRVIENGRNFFEELLEKVDKKEIQNDLNEYLTYEKEKEEIVEILNRVNESSQESIDKKIDNFLQNTSNQNEDDIDKIKKFEAFLKKKDNLLSDIKKDFCVGKEENILEWCSTSMREIVEYYLFLKKTLILWGLWNVENDIDDCFDDNDVDESINRNVDENSYINYTEDSSIKENDVKKSSEKQEGKINGIIHKFVSGEQTIEYIMESLNELIKKLDKAREERKGSLQYSGLFFVNTEGSIENIKFK